MFCYRRGATLVFNLYGNEDTAAIYTGTFISYPICLLVTSFLMMINGARASFWGLWWQLWAADFFSGSHYRLCVHINLEKWLMDSPTRTTGTGRGSLFVMRRDFFAMRSTDFETCALKNTYGRWRSEISYPHIQESPHYSRPPRVHFRSFFH